MRKTLIFIVSCYLFVGCSSAPDDFQSYTSKIQTISTPVTFQTMNPPSKTLSITDEKLFAKYKHIYADHIYGKIYESEMFLAILYLVNGDVTTPVIVTYDKIGNKIDSLNLFANASGLGENRETFVSTTLGADMTITEIDSTLIRHEIEITAGYDWPRRQIDTLHYTVSTLGKIIKD